MLTHRNLNWASHAYLSEVDETGTGDPILHAAPMSHGSGMYIMPHVAKGGVNVVPESGSFDPGEVFALIDRWQRLSMFAAPTMIKRLVESGADCNRENIRTFVWGVHRCIRRTCAARLIALARVLRKFTGKAKAR